MGLYILYMETSYSTSNLYDSGHNCRDPWMNSLDSTINRYRRGNDSAKNRRYIWILFDAFDLKVSNSNSFILIYDSKV